MQNDPRYSNIVISIHALVKRATSVKHHLSIPCNYFNPRPRKEGDPRFHRLFFFGYDFNPRPRKEGDRFIVYIIPPFCISIHALVKRATTLTVTGAAIADISIHALVKRATERHAGGVITDEISIHALVKRATKRSAISIAEEKISIHALVKRATLFLRLSSQISNYFNPRPRKEGDTVCSRWWFVLMDFNPRPRKEGDCFYY